MSLLNPSSLQYILNVSIFSRILVLIIQFASNILVSDHKADAYRNKYHEHLTTNSTSIQYLPDSYWYLYKCIQGLTNWDSQYFLDISLKGYNCEPHLAFLPLFPVSVSTVRQLLFEHGVVNLKFLSFHVESTRFDQEQVVTISDLKDYIKSAVVGVALNNFIYFPIACVALYLLTKHVKRKDEKYTKKVIWWFCFNPASIFFSACYSESLFSALTFTAMFLIEDKSQEYQTKDDNIRPGDCPNKTEFTPVKDLNRLLRTYLPALAFMALSTATRSNGLVTIGFLAYHLLLKYSPLLFTNRMNWTILLYLATVLEWLQDVIVLFISALIAASGYVTFQIYSYTKFCLNDNQSNRQKGIITLRPEWCDNMIPHAYGQVQSKYWDVGLFRYYQVKQLPNFLLALPISYLILFGSLNNSKSITRSKRGKRQLAYYIHAIILTIFCGISINVQVTTRLIASACPALYWICADLSEQSRYKSRLLVVYFIGYFILGSVLHPNFYPWT